MFQDILARAISHITGIHSYEMHEIPDSAIYIHERVWKVRSELVTFKFYKREVNVAEHHFTYTSRDRVMGYFIAFDPPIPASSVIRFPAMKIMFVNKYLYRMQEVWISRILMRLFIRELKHRLLS